MSPANDGLFGAILLNLDRDASRRIWMESQLAAANIAFERHSGVLGGEMLPAAVAPYFGGARPAFTHPLRVGEIGCYASHLMAMRRVASGALGPIVLVMEDDLIVSTDLVAIIRDALAKLPAGWDMLRLSNPPKRATRTVARLADGRELIRYSKIPNSAGAFLVTVAGARKFLKPGPRVLPADEDMRRPWRFGLQEYGVVPAPVQPDILDRSSIESLQPKSAVPKGNALFEALRKVEFSHLLARPAANMRDLGPGGWLSCLMRNGWDKVARATGLPGRLPRREPFRVTGARPPQAESSSST
jgi:glycosyl transferase family 25